MKLKSIKVNSTRAQQGAWIDGIPQMGDLALRVRGFSNTDYAAFMAREVAAVPRDQREGGRLAGGLLPNVRDAILTRGMVEHILLDWKNLTDEDDQPVDYSKEQAMTLLCDPDFRPLRDAVAWAANVVEEVEADKVETAVGNS